MTEHKDGWINEDYYEHPHCDDLILHGPSAQCTYCNAYPKRQQDRINGKINFTGEHDPDKTQCPSEARRPLEIIYKWYGNVPMTEERIKLREESWKKFHEEINNIL